MIINAYLKGRNLSRQEKTWINILLQTNRRKNVIQLHAQTLRTQV